MPNDVPWRSSATMPAGDAPTDEGEELPLPPDAPGHADGGAIDLGEDVLDLVSSDDGADARELDVGADEVFDEDGSGADGRAPDPRAEFHDEPDFEERPGGRQRDPEGELEVGLEDGVEDALPGAPDDGGRDGPGDEVPIDEAALPPLDAGGDDLPGDDLDEAGPHWVFDVSGPHEPTTDAAGSSASPPPLGAGVPPGDLLAWARTASSCIALRLDGGVPHLDRLRGDDGAWERTPLHVSLPAPALRQARLVANAAGAVALLAGGVVAGSRHPRATLRAMPIENAVAVSFLGDDLEAPLAVASAVGDALALDVFDGRGDATRVFSTTMTPPPGVELRWERERETLLLRTAQGVFELRRRLAH